MGDTSASIYQLIYHISYINPLAVRRAVVLGAGPIGNLVAQAARCDGARVLITDLSDYQLEVAHKCGLAATSNPQ